MVTLRQQFEEAARFLQSHEHFLLLTHVKPDGDALGACLGMAHILESMGKTYTLVNDDPIPAKFRFLPKADEFLLPADCDTTFRTAISFDCGDFARLGESANLLVEGARILNIDHHSTNDSFGSLNLIDSEAAATVEVVYDLARRMNLEITGDAALCLYTGLVTDTGGFRYSNTSKKVHLMAADLIGRGAEPYTVADKVLETMTFAQLRLISMVLSSIQVDPSGAIAWLEIPASVLSEAGASEEDAEGLVNYARNMEGVEVGISFREVEGTRIKVSFRSKYRVDVGQIALSLGGGGHARASGCTVEGTLPEVRERVLARVRDVFEAAV
jgi:phosphoesterase RecJ-like protein